LARANQPAIMRSEREGRSAVEHRGERRNIKQNDEAVPGFGVHGDREFEDEEGEERRRRQRDLAIPEPFDEWSGIIYEAADKYNIEAALIASLIWCESGGKNI